MVLKTFTNQSNRQVKRFRSYLLKITATRQHFFFLREGVRRLKLLLSGVDIFQIVTLNFWLSRFCVLLQAWDRKDENKVRKLLSSPWKFSREGSFFVCYPMAVITVEPAGKTSFVYSCM